MNFHPPRRQRGISLLVVMVMLLLTTLLLLWASRTALFNEMITGNDSDYQRAFEAAQAMVRDAELDILSERPDGSPCIAGGLAGKCRPWAPPFDIAAENVFFPTNKQELLDLENAFAATTPSCAAGLCVPTNVPELFWENETALASMKTVAAKYGQHTGALPATVGNPLLAGGSAWYWIELLPYQMGVGVFNGGLSSTLEPNDEKPYVYRITAIAQGRKANTQAVIRTIFVRKMKS